MQSRGAAVGVHSLPRFHSTQSDHAPCHLCRFLPCVLGPTICINIGCFGCACLDAPQETRHISSCLGRFSQRLRGRHAHPIRLSCSSTNKSANSPRRQRIFRCLIKTSRVQLVGHLLTEALVRLLRESQNQVRGQSARNTDARPPRPCGNGQPTVRGSVETQLTTSQHQDRS